MKKISINILMAFLILLSSFLFSCDLASIDKSDSETSNMVKVHFIDVDQGDAILIQYKDKNMLIDSSTQKAEDKFLDYLKKLNIKKFDAVIATHPDEDHIGNMDEVIKKYSITNFYAPKSTSTTKAFESMIRELKNKDLKIKPLKAGSTIDFDSDVQLEVFAPNSDSYEDANNYSPIIKLTYGNNSMLFTGDAEKLSEKETLKKGYNLESDVLKVGHHGSSTSTSKDFLKAVNPSIAIISCGKNNKYGHPHKETIKALEDNKVKYYRTDLDGTIVLVSDGTNIKKQ
ncbi:ComEC/Rec2 family competence protein [Clostridium sp. YIM B02506]|uniref:ComEC/Rec2 family competence protein n=1 Tax=Clostridium sp. YIM B02506 TaxID=2910680 RepID=UPI001EEF31F1|nr:ComEC/Rec2 family competence protein [Clostridium sp. YIM B02506]